MRGLTLRLVLLCLTVSWLSFPSLVAQNPRLIVVKTDGDELRRETRRLRTCPATLKNIRDALQEAIDLAPEVAVIRPTGLGNHIVRFGQGDAEETIVALVKQLEAKARCAATGHEYSSLSHSGLDLITALDRISPETAADLEDQWPSSPFAAQPCSNTLHPFATRKLFRSIVSDPGQLLAQLNTYEKGSPDYQARGDLLYHLMEHGKENAAGQLARDTVGNPAAFKEPLAFSQFAGKAITIFPELSEQVLAVLSKWYGTKGQSGGEEPAEFTIRTGERMKLTMADRELLRALQLTGRGNPEIALKIADLSPALRDQIRAAGGLNTFVNPDAGKPLFTQRGVRRFSPEQLQAKVNEAKDLAEIARLAENFCDEAPAKAEQVFAGALRRVLAETDGKKAAGDFTIIGRQCSSCLGELPDSWTQAGRALLDKAEQAWREVSQMATLRGGMTPSEAGIGIGNRSWRGVALGLRQFLIGQKARGDFQGAMEEAKAVEDKSLRFDLLVAIVTGLGTD